MSLGLFVGIFLMVPGLQIVGAALMCVPLRGNIPIAAAMTFLSNPLTTPFFLFAGIEVGERLGFHADLATSWRCRAASSRCASGSPGSVRTRRRRWSAGLFLIGLGVAFAGYIVSLVGMALVDWAANGDSAPARA